MKTTIVCGLLGSGKTTFIQNFLRDSTEKAVVLVNDFGKAGIDGEIFSLDGIESIELPSGCVCCTLKTDLITAVERIISTFAPEHLIIEPSGIASPSGVLEALDLLGIKQLLVVGIVDATEFCELYEAGIYGSFFHAQVANADVVLINKTDLADEDKLSKTLILVGDINPGAIVFLTVRAKLETPLPLPLPGERSIQRHASHLLFDTATFGIAKTVAFSSYKSIFEDLKEGVYGSVVRAKSLVVTDQGPFRFDLSYGTIDVSPLASSPAGSRLVIIGQKLEKNALSQALAAVETG